MKKVFCFLFGIILLGSCSQEESIIPSPQTQPQSNVIGIPQAKKRLQEIITEINSQTKDEINRIPTVMSSEVVALDANKSILTRAESESAQYYVIRFENDEGFAIMGATPDMPELLAIGQGPPNFEDPEALLPNENYWAMPAYPPLNDTTAIVGGGTGTVMPVDTAWILMNSYPVYRKPTYTIYNEGGLCKVKWGQHNPFHIYTPINTHIWTNEKDSSVWYDTGHSATNCVVTALAQIMTVEKLWGAYYKDRQYDWPLLSTYRDRDDLRTDSAILKTVAQLMLDLGNNENLDVSYGRYSSWAYLTDVAKTLKNYHFSNTGTTTYSLDFDILKQELMDGYPVIFSAGCKDEDGKMMSGNHAWICHGLMEVTTPLDYYTSKESYEAGNEPILRVVRKSWMLQMNWGWDGESDGYYALGKNFDTYHGPDYQEYVQNPIRGWGSFIPSTVRMIHGIRF